MLQIICVYTNANSNFNVVKTFLMSLEFEEYIMPQWDDHEDELR